MSQKARFPIHTVIYISPSSFSCLPIHAIIIICVLIKREGINAIVHAALDTISARNKKQKRIKHISTEWEKSVFENILAESQKFKVRVDCRSILIQSYHTKENFFINLLSSAYQCLNQCWGAETFYRESEPQPVKPYLV